jgi:hypothetical protein
MTRLLLLHTGPPCTSDQQVLWLRGAYGFQDNGLSLWNATWRTGWYFGVAITAAANTIEMVDYLNDHCPCAGMARVLHALNSVVATHP